MTSRSDVVLLMGVLAACAPESKLQRLSDVAACDDEPPVFGVADGVDECPTTADSGTPVPLWRWSDNPAEPEARDVVSAPIAFPVADSDGDGQLTARDRPSLFAAVTDWNGNATDIVRLDGATGAFEGSLVQVGGLTP